MKIASGERILNHELLKISGHDDQIMIKNFQRGFEPVAGEGVVVAHDWQDLTIREDLLDEADGGLERVGVVSEARAIEFIHSAMPTTSVLS